MSKKVPTPISGDFLIVADGAQVQNGKLYVLGGGWDTISIVQYPTTHHMSVAAGILVPWSETNHRHRLKIEVRNEDLGGEVVAKVEGEFIQGRPATVTPGTTQRVLLAFDVAVNITGPSQLVAELTLNGRTSRETHFAAKRIEGPVPVPQE